LNFLKAIKEKEIIKKSALTNLDNISEANTQAAEGKLSDYIVALQGYFRKQEDNFIDYFVKHRKKLSKIKPVNLDKLTGDKKPKNKLLQSFIDSYDFRKQEDDLLTILKFIHHNTTPHGVTNAITLINQVAKIKGYKKRKKTITEKVIRLFKIDIADTVEYANSPQFAADAQSYIQNNYDEFLSGAKEISKNINSETSSLIYNQLYEGIEKLESMDDLAVRVGNVYDGCSQSRALMIARTETLRSFNTSTIDSYKVAKIKKAQILIANDERTCEICLGLSGLIMPVDEARSCLPVHPRCRCTWIVVIGEPILAEPKLADVQNVIRDNPKIPIAEFIKVPKMPSRSNLDKALVKLEEKIKNKGIEKAYVLNENGDILLVKQGTSMDVSFTKKEIGKIKNHILTHNHPGNGHSFSFNDLNFASDMNLKEIRAISHTYNYKYSMKPKLGKNWPLGDDLIAEFKFQQDKLFEKYMGQVYDKTKKISWREASEMLSNKINENIAKKFDLIYTRKI